MRNTAIVQAEGNLGQSQILSDGQFFYHFNLLENHEAFNGTIGSFLKKVRKMPIGIVQMPAKIIPRLLRGLLLYHLYDQFPYLYCQLFRMIVIDFYIEIR